MSRSLRLNKKFIALIKQKMKRLDFSQESLGTESGGLSRATIQKFLSGEPIERSNFIEIAETLNLDWRNIRYYEMILDWGESIDVDEENFFGRSDELKKIENIINNDRCNLIIILGMGGMGKTTFARKVANNLYENYECIVWRSLRDYPTLNKLLLDLLKTLSKGSVNSLKNTEKGINQLSDYLKIDKCLIILDNFESILQDGNFVGDYKKEYKDYRRFLDSIVKAQSKSTVLITTREKPNHIRGENSQSLYIENLPGLSFEEGKSFFIRQKIYSDDNEAYFREIIKIYDGNPFFIELAANYIKDNLFEDIASFLKEAKFIVQSQIASNSNNNQNSINEILDWYFKRLFNEDKDNYVSNKINYNQSIELLYWMAINRKPISIEELRDDLLYSSQEKLEQTIERLHKRIVIKKIKERKQYALPDVLLEYLTHSFVETMSKEIISGKLLLVKHHSILKAQSPFYIQEIQRKLIIEPIIKKVELQTKKYIEDVFTRLLKLANRFKESQIIEEDYLIGNTLNILIHVNFKANSELARKVDFNKYDFSKSYIKQVNFQEILLHDVNFSDSTFDSCTFTQKFADANSLSFNSSGKFLASGGTSGEITIWNTNSYSQEITIIENEEGKWIYSLLFHPRKEYLIASGSDTREMKLWNTSEGKIICQPIYKSLKHEGMVRSLSFSIDGKYLVSGCHGGLCRLWDVGKIEDDEDDEDELITELNFYNTVWSTTFSSNGRFLAIVAETESAKVTTLIYELEGLIKNGTNEEPFWILPDPTAVFPIAFHPKESNILCSYSQDNEIKFWNLETRECSYKFATHHKNIRSIVFSKDAKTIACNYNNNSIQLHTVNSNFSDRVLHKHKNEIRALAFHPTQDQLVSSGYDSTIRFWNTQTTECIHIVNGYNSTVRTMAFHPRKNLLVAGSDDSLIRLWDVNNIDKAQPLIGHNGKVWALGFNNDGKIIASSGQDRTIRLWDVEQKKPRNEPFYCDTGSLLALAFSPYESKLIVSDLISIKVLEIKENFRAPFLKKTIKDCHEGEILALAFSSDGKFFASSDDKEIRIWNTYTYKEIKELSPLKVYKKKTGIRSICFSPLDNHIIVSGDDANQVICWKIIETKKPQKLWVEKHKDKVKSVAFSPCGNFVISASEDKTVKLISMKTGKCQLTKLSSKEQLHAVCFNSQGNIIASGGEEQVIRLYYLDENKLCEHEFNLHIAPPYNNMEITNIKAMELSQINSLKSLGAKE